MLKSAKKLKENGKGAKKAFIFTTDAFLVLPLVILVISSFVSFSVTIRETVVMQEYAYLIGRDSLQYLSEISGTEAGIATSSRSALEYIIVQIANNDLVGARNSITSILGRSIPPSVGYVFEYYDQSSATWVQVIQGGNALKTSNPKFQVTASKVVTALTDPVTNQFSSCAAAVTCTNPPSTRYVAGKVFGPTYVRLRIFI